MARPCYTRRRLSGPFQPHEFCRESKPPYILIDSYPMVALDLSFCFATITTTITVTVTVSVTVTVTATVVYIVGLFGLRRWCWM